MAQISELTFYRKYNEEPLGMIQVPKITEGYERASGSLVTNAKFTTAAGHYASLMSIPNVATYQMTGLSGFDLINYDLWCDYNPTAVDGGKVSPVITRPQYDTVFNSTWTLPLENLQDIIDSTATSSIEDRQLYLTDGTRITYNFYKYNYTNGIKLTNTVGMIRVRAVEVLTGWDEGTQENPRHEPIYKTVTGELAPNYIVYSFNCDTTRQIDISAFEFDVRQYDRNDDAYSIWNRTPEACYMFVLRLYGNVKVIQVDESDPEHPETIEVETIGWSDPTGLIILDKRYITTSEGESEPENFKKTKNTKIGGRGSGAWTNRSNGERMNIADRRAAFSFCSTTGNGLTCYRLGDVAYLQDTILELIYCEGVERDNSYLRSALVSAYMLPYCPDIKSPTFTRYQTWIRVADQTFEESYYATSKEVVLTNLSGKYGCIYDLSGLGWDDFNDWETQFELFLPFVGTINLDAKSIAQGQLYVIYTINVYNGNVVYWVYTKCLDSTTDTLYGTYSGNCAIEIPLMGAGESGSVLGKITNTVSGLATGIASIASAPANPIGAIAGVTSSMGSIVEGLNPPYHVDKSGTIDTNSSTQAPYRISLKVKAPRVVRLGLNTIETTVKGKPSYFNCLVSDLPDGLNIISDINLNKVNASDAEKDKIRSIMKGGVFK